MDDILKNALKTVKLHKTGFKREGTISSGETYDTDHGAIFIKCNNTPQARKMYDGEFTALASAKATKTVKVPTPITVLDHPDGGACLVTEHLEMNVLLNKYSAELGHCMAGLHLHNESLSCKTDSEYVDKFGFQKTTFHQNTPQDNSWKNDWMKKEGEARDLWSKLKVIIPSFFKDITVKPSFLHGDFWSGNVAETSSYPVVFDFASSFYGHHEYDIAVSTCYGGFTPHFYNAYHKIIPKAPGFEKRKKLYRLFQYIHNWNYKSDCYRRLVILTMKALLV